VTAPFFGGSNTILNYRQFVAGCLHRFWDVKIVEKAMLSAENRQLRAGCFDTARR
jgi:hypothetical protein